MVLALGLTLTFSNRAIAQNWSFDAREIGMGGVSQSSNLATKMIDEEKPYRTIVIPFGVLQIVNHFDIFDPTSDKFNPITAVEYAASPIHYIVGRLDTDSAESLFVSDVRNANLTGRLSRYQGFAPASDILAEGLGSPNWGYTYKFHKQPDGTFQGVYVGAGPYLSMHSQSTIDQGLINVFATGVDVPNAQFPLTEVAEGQVAMAITAGYRGRFAWPTGIGSGSPREGLYIAANYNILHGFHYENDNLTVKVLTNSAALVSAGSNVVVQHRDADNGSGFGVDLGVGAVIKNWDFGLGVRGIANRMKWKDVEQTIYTLNSLTSGNDDFASSVTIPVGETRVELPVDTRADVVYHADGWTAAAEVGHGFGGGSFHAGLERRLGMFQARGGVRYTVKIWNPAGGVGVDLSRHMAIDVAAYGTSANIEQKRKMAIAVSLRINHL